MPMTATRWTSTVAGAGLYRPTSNEANNLTASSRKRRQHIDWRYHVTALQFGAESQTVSSGVSEAAVTKPDGTLHVDYRVADNLQSALFSELSLLSTTPQI